MPWTRKRPALPRAAEHRLQRLAAQWRPVGPSDVARPVDGADAGRLSLPGWGRSALRGLAVIMAAVLLFVGYQAWFGRPRAVADVPVPLATGVPGVGFDRPSSVAGGASGSASMVDPGEQEGAAVAGAAAGAPVVVGDDVPLDIPSSGTEAGALPVGGVDAPPERFVVVHVIGQVAEPGLVRLAEGARVADAIEAAGGVTRPRAAETVNLARLLVDGEQVAVGIRPGGATAASPAASTPSRAAAPNAAPLLVDLNTASAQVLDSLPGIGPVIAGRIVAWRVANGSFRSIDELGEVAGIGDAILGQIRGLVRI